VPRAFPPGTAESRHHSRPILDAGSSRPCCHKRCSARRTEAYRWKCSGPSGSRQQRTPAAHDADTFRTIPIPTAWRAAGRRALAAVRAGAAWFAASRVSCPVARRTWPRSLFRRALRMTGRRSSPAPSSSWSCCDRDSRPRLGSLHAMSWRGIGMPEHNATRCRRVPKRGPGMRGRGQGLMAPAWRAGAEKIALLPPQKIPPNWGVARRALMCAGCRVS
jgi:hypothetical protein